MKKSFFFLLLSIALTACVSNKNAAMPSPEVIAPEFIQNLLSSSQTNLEDKVVADIAFLDGHTQNSHEGRLVLHRGLQMMAQYLRHTIAEAGINSEKAVFVSALDAPIQANDLQTNVILHIYNPDTENKGHVDAAQLITRWRRTEEGWKLDMNPYLDNFRHIQ